MRLQKQLYNHDPENGIWGDCFRTCLAIILDRDAAEVPHFMDGNPPDCEVQIAAWLKSQGLVLIRVKVDGSAELDSVLNMGAEASPLPYILSGYSRTPADHCVVCHGDQIVCDPSLTDAGIIGPLSNNQWWVEWLVHHDL